MKTSNLRLHIDYVSSRYFLGFFQTEKLTLIMINNFLLLGLTILTKNKQSLIPVTLTLLTQHCLQQQ